MKTPVPIQKVLSRYYPEHQEDAGGLGTAEKGTTPGGVRYSCVVNVLVGGDASRSVV